MPPSSVLLFHKVPAFWESEARSNPEKPHPISSDFPSINDLSPEESSLLSGFEEDIFFLLARNIADYLSIEKVDVVLGQDKSEVRNWDVISRDGVIEQDDKFVFWSTSSSDLLPDIDSVEVLVLRGNYPNFHNQLISKYKPAATVLYPATSLFFPHFSDRMRELIPLVLKGHISLEEITYYLENLSRQPVFSKVKMPEIKSKMTDLEVLEFRKLFRNFLESCIKISNGIRERRSPGNYSIVLYDEKSNLESLSAIYPNSRLVKFNKAASPIFNLDLQSVRNYDLLFTGTTIQKTKNHPLFYEIVDKILSVNSEIRIAIVGVTDGIEDLQKRWKDSEVELFGRISKKELCEIYNKSKSHVVTSGRDCFPRTIPESIACGCHVLALDILSDGLSVLSENPLIGTVIDTKEDLFSLEPSYSTSIALSSENIVDQILTQLSVRRDPLLIATLGGEIFPIDCMVQLDMIWQEIDLSLRNL
tara:strand:- start:181 stop:1605 length:1425 start_codon:yes stop_codon:yes gene_type:complete